MGRYRAALRAVIAALAIAAGAHTALLVGIALGAGRATLGVAAGGTAAALAVAFVVLFWPDPKQGP